MTVRISVLLFFHLILYSYSSAQETDSTLIAWYTLDGQATDRSVYGNDGSLFNLLPATDRFGSPEKALEFNGSSAYISIPSSVSLESPDSTITMLAWIYMFGWSKVGTQFNPVLMKSAEGTNAFQYRLSVGAGGLNANFNNWNAGYTASFTFDFYNWYMVAVTYDSDSLRFYVDGRLIASNAFTENMIADPRPLEIGRDVPGITEFFNGRIDEVRVYNRALTENEISDLYDNYHQTTQIFEPVQAFPDSGSTTGAYAPVWGDYNTDGYPDLFLSTIGDSNFFFTQIPPGTFFRENTSQFFPGSSNSRGGAWADYDNDGDLDLLVIRFSQKNILYENRGDGTFTEQTGSPVSELSRSSTDAAWGDYDGDSWLDLIVTNRDQANELYHNNGDGSFTRIDTGVVATDNRSSITPAWIDVDGDRDPDLYITNTFGNNNFLYINQGSGYFVRNDTSVISTDGKHGSSPSWGDYDNDGDLDLFVSNTNTEPGENNALYRNEGSGIFTRVVNSPVSNDKGVSAGSSWGDIDNDGDIDLVVANGEFVGARKNFIYLNKGRGEFERITGEAAAEDPGQTDGISLIDWDGDGALELFLANRDRNCAAYENTSQSNWLAVRCTGTTSNRSGIGAIVRIKAIIDGENIWQTRLVSSNSGRRSTSGLIQHFGLGDAAIIDSLVLEWPSGLIETYTNLEINRIHLLTEGDATAIGVNSDDPDRPSEFMLYQNYPNPFNPATMISWQLAAAGQVELQVYNVLGKKVATLVSKPMGAGKYSHRFEAAGLASGIYFYQLTAGTFRQVRKMIVLR